MVSVDTVYQRVLAITNKEQRGYITPQEFNLLANQAQSEIFEDYFAQMSALLINTEAIRNESEYYDAVKSLDEKVNFSIVSPSPFDFLYCSKFITFNFSSIATTLLLSGCFTIWLF